MLYDLIRKNRSYRSFSYDRPVTRAEAVKMIECARISASTANIQPLKFHIATGELCTEILPLTAWAGLLRGVVLPPEGHEPTAYITVLFDKSVAGNPEAFMRDVGIVAEVILLAATEMGLGGCMIGSFKKDELISLLKMPENLVPCLVIALGKPDEEVRLTDCENGNAAYYRHDGVHYVPKRSIDDIIIRTEVD